jgi:hypothetical protein
MLICSPFSLAASFLSLSQTRTVPQNYVYIPNYIHRTAAGQISISPYILFFKKKVMIMQSLNMFALITIFFTPIYASLEPRQVYPSPPLPLPFQVFQMGKLTSSQNRSPFLLLGSSTVDISIHSSLRGRGNPERSANHIRPRRRPLLRPRRRGNAHLGFCDPDAVRQ